MTEEIRNWMGSRSTRPSKIKEVHSVEDIIEAVTNHDEYPSPVRALGSRHSPTDCIDADGGTVLDMRSMNKIEDPNVNQMTITVGAGASYYDVSRLLEASGLMHYINTEFGNLSAGAAAVAQTKDSAFPGEHGQVCSYVVAMKIVTAEGKILEVSEEGDPQMMHYLRGSYGMLGVVYEVTYKVTTLKLMKLYHKVFTLEGFLENLDDIRACGCSVFFYFLIELDYVIVEYRSYQPPEVLETVYEKTSGDGVLSKRLLSVTSDWQYGLRNKLWAYLSPMAGSIVQVAVPRPLKDVMYSIAGYATMAALATLAGYNIRPASQTLTYAEKPFLPGLIFSFSFFAFRIASYPQALRDYFAFAKDYKRRTGWRCSTPSVGYHLHKDTGSFLSYSAEGEVMTVDPVSTIDEGWEPFLDEFNKFCSPRGGKPLFNQTARVTSQQFQAAYGPQLRDFGKLRKKMDADGRFLSGFFKDRCGF